MTATEEQLENLRRMLQEMQAGEHSAEGYEDECVTMEWGSKPRSITVTLRKEVTLHKNDLFRELTAVVDQPKYQIVSAACNTPGGTFFRVQVA